MKFWNQLRKQASKIEPSLLLWLSEMLLAISLLFTLNDLPILGIIIIILGLIGIVLSQVLIINGQHYEA